MSFFFSNQPSIKNRIVSSKQPLLQALTAHILNYPTPINLNYA
jgi:hypothetical protein